MSPRAHPFDLVFGPLADDRFPPIAAALLAEQRPSADRDAFLMTRGASELLRELRGDDAVGDAMDEMVAFAHHAFMFWHMGARTVPASPADLAALLDVAPTPPRPMVGAPYIQFPERRLWGRVLADGPHEPLDGVFVHQAGDDERRVLGVFGLHPQRDGFSVAEVSGPSVGTLERVDGTAPYAPRMAGGAEAGLLSVDDAAELLALGWNVDAAEAVSR